MGASSGIEAARVVLQDQQFKKFFTLLRLPEWLKLSQILRCGTTVVS